MTFSKIFSFRNCKQMPSKLRICHTLLCARNCCLCTVKSDFVDKGAFLPVIRYFPEKLIIRLIFPLHVICFIFISIVNSVIFVHLQLTPSSGAIYGNMLLQVEGRDLGTTSKDVENITVAGKSCHFLPSLYVTSKM